jgi:hypothetical protein
MTSDRAEAYGRVTATLADVGPAKLQPAEVATIRDTADTLLFCEDVAEDTAAQDALAVIEELVDRLVESDRWTAERADALLHDVEACGPAVAR